MDIYQLVQDYYDAAEAYDRSVCTGPILHGSIIPASPKEMGLVNRNANTLLRELYQKAEHAGYSREDVRSAKSRYLRK